MENKLIAHVPVEQYGFISVEMKGTAEDIVEAYREVAELVKVQPKGLEEKVFNSIIDNMIEGKPNQIDPGILEGLNPVQSAIFNGIRKSKGRINTRSKQ